MLITNINYIIFYYSTIEGIGLTYDPSYSIVKECYPYLAKRLLSDDSPRVRDALETFLYGSMNENQQQQSQSENESTNTKTKTKTSIKRLNLKRLDELAEGYTKFTVMSSDVVRGKTFQDLKYTPLLTTKSTSGVSNEGSNNSIDPVMTSLIKILFSAQGNYVQEILLDEAVRITDALTRSLITTAITKLIGTTSSSSFSSSSGIGSTKATVTRKPFSFLSNPLNPVKSFQETSQRLDSIFRASAEDIESLKVLKRLLQILAGVTAQTKDDNNNVLSSSLQLSSSSGGAGGSGGGNGIIDGDDLQLVQKVITRISASLLNQKRIQPSSSSSSAAVKTIQLQQSQPQPLLNEDVLDEETNINTNNNNNGNQQRLERLAVIRSQLQEVLPLIRESTPGVRKISGMFLKKLVDRSVSRMTETL